MSDRALFLTLSDGLYGGEKCLIGMLSGFRASTNVEPIVVVPAEGRLTEELQRRGIAWEVHALLEAASVWQLPGQLLQAWLWLRALKPRLIYFNANTYWRPLEIPVAALMGIPVVTHHHLVPDMLSPFHRHNRLVIANSRYVASRLQVGSVAVLDNPVELERFADAKADPEAYGIAPGELGVFFIGQIKPIKGVDLFLDAAERVIRQFQNARFVLIGDAPDPVYASHVAQRVAAIGQVCWMRFENQIERAYAAADLVVMPSLWDEPFGRIAIEAGAAAKPIVCTSVGGIPEIVSDGDNGLLVSRDDISQLVSAIVNLLQNPELRRRLGQAGRRHAEERFAAAIVTQRLSELLMPLLRTSAA